MAKYLKKFQTQSEYLEYIGGEDAVLPNVSYCEDDVENAHFNPAIEWSKRYLCTTALESGTISFNIPASVGTGLISSISYSIDESKTWITTENQNSKGSTLVISVEVNEGERVLWKGNANQTGSSTSIYSFFSSTAEFNVEGNVMSLCYGDDFASEKELTYNFQFVQLFNSSKIVNAKNLVLPATTLADNCYSNMFNGCTSLVTAPELPATTLVNNCYSHMFKNCTSLTKAPELPAMTLAQNCYGEMFRGCTSLVTAPELPATTLANSCYIGMFSGCTSLVTAPELPATTLDQYCYASMFEGCTSLVTAPELPATTLAYCCYQYMFYGCTSLVTAPELPATTLANYCYVSMFKNCTSLNYIKAMFTTAPSNTYTQNWVQDVAASGTFVKNSTATWDVTGVNGVPSGWTVESA